MRKITNYLSLLSVLITTLSGCGGNIEDKVERELYDVLGKASGGKGKSFFILPNSDDYDNIPQDTKNPISKDKVILGKYLFHDPCMGGNPRLPQSFMTYSCASCHNAKAGFQANMPQGIGEGGLGFGNSGEGRFPNPAYPTDSLDLQPVRTPSAMNMAYQTNILWNGQFGAKGVNIGTAYAWTPGTPKSFNTLGYEGVETQAIAGQKVHRMKMDTSVMDNFAAYKYLFDVVYSNLSEDKRMTRETAGLAIAAYERTLLANQAPFQRWLKGEAYAMSFKQKQGAILFFGKANCYKCHNGPALNAMAFYALGMNDLTNGNYGVVASDPTKPEHKGRGGFTGKEEDMYAFKVPQLYNLKDSKFYGHGASFTSIMDVLVYKNNAVPQNSKVPAERISPDFVPLQLTYEELKAIEDFVANALYDDNLERYVPTTLPSKLCFPNNDIQSKIDMDCL